MTEPTLADLAAQIRRRRITITRDLHDLPTDLQPAIDHHRHAITHHSTTHPKWWTWQTRGGPTPTLDHHPDTCTHCGQPMDAYDPAGAPRCRTHAHPHDLTAP